MSFWEVALKSERSLGGSEERRVNTSKYLNEKMIPHTPYEGVIATFILSFAMHSPPIGITIGARNIGLSSLEETSMKMIIFLDLRSGREMSI